MGTLGVYRATENILPLCTTMLLVHVCRSSRPTLRLALFPSVTRKYSLPAEPPKKSKVWDSVDEAVKDIKSGDVLLCGGARHCLSRRSFIDLR